MKVDKLVPEVYYKESRDFSFVGRLFEVLLNYMKTNGDLVYSDLNSENIKSMLIDLLNTTLGFESKHEYITKDLIYIASAFSDILRKKGTKAALNEIVDLLLTSQGIYLKERLEESAEGYLLYPEDDFVWKLIIPTEMKDVVLLEDLLDYVLPAGTLLDISVGNIITEKRTSKIAVSEDKVLIDKILDDQLGLIYYGDSNLYSGLSNAEVSPMSNESNALYPPKSITGLGVVVSNITSNETEGN